MHRTELCVPFRFACTGGGDVTREVAGAHLGFGGKASMKNEDLSHTARSAILVGWADHLEELVGNRFATLPLNTVVMGMNGGFLSIAALSPLGGG